MTTESLGHQASRGGASTLLGQLIRVGIYALSVFVLARLLSPQDYGLLAMVVAVIGIGEIFRDFGLSFAAIQAKTLSQHERSNLFWLSSGLGAALGLVVFLSSWPIATFYGDTRLIALTQVLSVTFVANGLAAQLKANLTRSMRFTKLALSEIIASLVGLVVAVTLALLGAGYWALVFQQVGTQATLLVYFAIVGRWIPSAYSRTTPVRHFVNYGTNMLGAQLLSYASRNVDSVVIGATMGPRATGIYNMAFQLMILPLNQLNAPATRVAFPILSRLQDDDRRYAAFLLRGQILMVYGLVAAFGLAVPLAPQLIQIALGPNWSSSAPIFQILAIGGVAQTVSYATYWVFLSKGLSRSQFWWALVTRPFVVLCILLGALWGIEGVAWAYSLSLVVLWPLGIIWVARQTPLRISWLFVPGLRAIVVFLICGAAAWLASAALDSAFIEPISPWFSVALGTIAYAATFALLWLMSRHVRQDVQEISHTVSLLRKKDGPRKNDFDISDEESN